MKMVEPEIEDGSEPVATPAPIVTYSLAEVAAMVLPADWSDAERWLKRRLTLGEARGYKIGRVWRMTHDDVQDFISSRRPPPPPKEEERYPGGLTRRSWLNLQRGRARTPAARMESVSVDTTYPKTHPVGDSWTWVRPAPPEVIAAMPALTDTQLDLLNRVQSEGELRYSGRAARKTVEALARRGLVTYDAEYVCEEGQSHYFVRFTVRVATA